MVLEWVLVAMGSASRYWQLIRIDATGKRRVSEIEPAKSFFYRQFDNLIEQDAVSDAPIQRQLLSFHQQEQRSNPSTPDSLAGCCLRCYISHQIEQVCIQLEFQFGSRHGFTRADLFPFVLDDEIRERPLAVSSSRYRSFASEILRTYDSSRAGLNTWVFRRMRFHRELNCFLHERGVYLISDWAILNDTSPEQLQRILSEFYTLTSSEIEQACDLLQSYHLIYRQDRLQQRQAGKLKSKEMCLPPTIDQLTRIAQTLQNPTIAGSPDRLISQLQTLAAKLRRYRIFLRTGVLPTQFVDTLMEVPSPPPDEETGEFGEFLRFYRAQFLDCLDQVLAQVIEGCATHLQRKNPETAQQFLTALELFHCQGRSMGEIAPQIGLQAQYQVTRLMKLKDFRASVRQRLLKLLLDRVLNQAKIYVGPDRLQELDRRIEAALEEQISSVIQQAEAEAAVAKDRPLTSLFARRLCRQLTVRKRAPC